MKPIRLTMRAFGPYKNEEIIDFTKLRENRLFVISGATGAGKTTIFDGICFALYGTGSGSDRKEIKMLRSDFADEDVHTAVELIFEIHNKTYRVLRQMSHVKKGNKSATGEKYELFEVLDNGEEVPAVERQKSTDINKKLEELIGLTYDQFSQIVLLPQGEFRKLLTSQTENKEEILRKIFKTNRYGEMAQKLEGKKQQAEQKLNEARILKNSYIGQLSGALPIRESYLFSLLDKNANIYQIQDALNEELVFYQQKIEEDKKLYEETFENHKKSYDIFVANKMLNDRIDAYNQKVLKLSEIEKEKPTYDQMKIEYEAAIRASQIEPVYKHLLTLQQEIKAQQNKLLEATEHLEQSKGKLVEAKDSYDQEMQNEPLREEALKKVMELEKLLPLFEEVEKQEQLVDTLQKELAVSKSTLTQLENELEKKKSSRKTFDSSIEQLEASTENMQQVVENQNELKEIVNIFKQYNDVQGKLITLNKQFQNALEIYNNAKSIYEVEESKWFNNQAAVLAAKLVQGTPCPVCGSTEHQSSHTDLVEMTDDKKVKQLKADLSKKEQAKFECQANAGAMQAQLDRLIDEVKNLNANLDDQQTYIQQYNEINEHVKSLQKESELLSEQRKQLKKLITEEQQLEQERSKLEQQHSVKDHQLVQQSTILEQKRLAIPKELKDLSELQTALNKAISTKNTLNEQWDQVQKVYQIAQKNLSTIEETVKLTSQRVNETESKLKNSKEEFNHSLTAANFESVEAFINAKRTDGEQKQLNDQYINYTNELHSLSTQVNEESEQLKDKEKIDLSDVEEQLDALKRDYERALQQLNSTKSYEQICMDYSEKLQQIASEIIELEESSNQIVDLYNLLRGQNSKKISFERYVQMGYLEQITEAANIRLRNLSNGQFYLQCSDRQESHGRQSGLSLDVYDTYTGQSRDVKSLSGGEKFNASLCLALGMADVIQSYQGNVQIDTMFIDEGFGSLDEESLMKAIDTLIDLQKSGRMIGVISHVAELKAAMPAILQVEKLKEGYSKTSIIVK